MDFVSLLFSSIPSFCYFLWMIQGTALSKCVKPLLHLKIFNLTTYAQRLVWNMY